MRPTTRPRGRTRRLASLALALAALGVGVGAGPVSAAAHGRAGSVDWPMYGFDLQRTGENPSETILTPSTVAGLHELWSFDLGAVSIMQPVAAVGVTVNGSSKDLVY